MARLTISPSAARRHALGWRVAAVALAAGAGALWAFQTPLGSPSVSLEAASENQATEPVGPPRAPTTLASLDAEAARGVQDRLDHAYDRPPRPQPEGEPQPSMVVAIATWRYLGAITTSKHRSALVSVDARQHVVREGAALRYKDTAGEDVSVTLVEVTPDYIVIDDGSGLREIKREMRTGPAVAWVTPGMNLTPDQMQRRAELEAARAAHAAGANGMAVTPPGMAPDQQAMLRDRGISPAQATQARERLDQLRARARSRGAATVAGPDGTTTTRDGSTKGPKDSTENDAPESNR